MNHHTQPANGLDVALNAIHLLMFIIQKFLAVDFSACLGVHVLVTILGILSIV